MPAILLTPLTGPLTGSVAPATDKSITHRALFFAALNRGRTIIHDPSPAADCRSTLALLRALGIGIRESEGRWELEGQILHSHSRELTLDCGNSGTTVRMASGFLTGERGRFTLTGDPSLSLRPMERVASPLRTLGASVATAGGHLPMTIDAIGVPAGLPGGLAIDAASAQVHAALVLAMLRSERGGAVRRTTPMRDHTLRMARRFGVEIITEMVAGAPADHIRPARIERDVELRVPGDISSAAFLIAAGMLLPGSSIRLRSVGLNPTRTAFLDLLVAMGGRLQWSADGDDHEPVGTIEVESSPDLKGIMLDEAGPFNVAEMIDELPLLALIASQAHGRTTVRGAAELRVKESDRITATARLLASLGITIEEHEDGFSVDGPQEVRGGATVDHHGDHRLCMVAAVAAIIAAHPVVIPDPDVAAVSYPAFWDDLERLAGVRFAPLPAGEERG